MAETQDDNRVRMVFARSSEEGKQGTDAWFWPRITAAGEGDEDIFPFPIQIALSRKMINVEQARYLTAHGGEKATSLRQWQQLLAQYEAEQQAERANDYDQHLALAEAGDD